MDDIQRIVVIGGGVMGAGIAELLASNGFETTVLEKDIETTEQTKQWIEQSLERKLSKWGITSAEKKMIWSRLTITSDVTVLKEADFVFESVNEEIEAKKIIFQECDQYCSSEVIIASNTSTLSLTEIAAVTKRPDKVIGLHFVYPVTTNPVVEVVRGLKTSNQTVETVRGLLPHLGLSGIEVFESPGFVTTRLICLLINEALNILMEGVATAEEIDRAMKEGHKFHVGPIETADRLGLDSVLAALERMYREFGDTKFRPAPLLKKLVRAGHLGVKTGEGFFRYDSDGVRIQHEGGTEHESAGN